MNNVLSITIGIISIILVSIWIIFFSTEFKRQFFFAQQGNADAQVFIAKNYHSSAIKHNKDQCQANRWWVKAAHQNHPEAKQYLGDLLIQSDTFPDCLSLSTQQQIDYTLFATEQGNYAGYAKLAESPKIPVEQRIQHLENGALHHEPNALYALAIHYLRKNLPYSLHLLEKAAQLHHIEAQTFLGDIYAGMTYTHKYTDYTKAVYWYTKAAQQKNLTAQKNLGLMYLYGQGSQQNYDQAAYWLKQASVQQDKESQLTLAMLILLEKGIITTTYGSKNEKFKLISTLAQQGYVEAQVELARLYLFGISIPQNYTKAAEWFQIAANQSDRLAQYQLGQLYLKGKGVPQNAQKAQSLFYQARYSEYLDTSKPQGKALVDQGYPQFKSY